MQNITIYGKTNCSQCTMAKNWLDSRKIAYDYLQLDQDFVREDVTSIAPTARSYPVIVVDGQYIGGFEALAASVILEGSDSSRNLLTEG